MTEVSLKLVPGFRNHILITLLFVTSYLKVVENGTYLEPDLPLPAPDAFKEITTEAEVEAMRQKIAAIPEGEEVRLANRDNLLLHACFVLMSYGLITPLGEKLCELILAGMSEGHPLREFAEFRRHYLMVNTHLIENAGQTLKNIPGFEEMQEALSSLSND